jgi:outer membrane protein assembly factor BamB
LHGYASSTPVTDGEALYVFLGKSGVLKYSLDGDLLWQVSVGTGLDKHNWGSGTSLILHGDLLIVNASAESQSIRALKKSSGEQVWQVDGIVDSWSTPLVVKTADGGEELVVVERFKVLGLNPATGEQLWVCNKPSDYVCPSVIANDGIVYVINSRFQALLLAIRTGGRGDVSDSHVLWTKKWTTRVSTPVYHDGHLYALDQAGYASCINTKTGEEVFRQRLDISGDGDKIYASLVAAAGKVYGVTRLDGTVVLALQPELKILARNYLDDDTVFNATPAIVDGQLLIRSDKALYCIGK